MRILHITTYPTKGKKHSGGSGVASYTKNLISNTPYSLEDQVYVLANKISNEYQKYSDLKIEIIRTFSKNPKYIFQLYQQVRQLNPDLIHIQQELGLFGNKLTALLLQWLLFFLRKYPLIITLHGVVSLTSINKQFVKDNNSRLPVLFVKLAFFIIYKPLCIWSKKIIVHETLFRNILVKEYYVNPNKIEVIYHGVENLKLLTKKPSCQKLNLRGDLNYLLFIGYLTGYKGLDLLIEGFAKYALSNPSVCLLIGAGVHPDLKTNKDYCLEYLRLFQKAKDLINNSQFKWLGFIREEDLPFYFSISDLSIYPYTTAMSSSGPMALSIGYSQPFIASEVFTNMFNHTLIFPRKPEELKSKIEHFFQHKHSYLNYIKQLKQERNWSKIGQKTYSLYQKIYEKN